jgi:tetratricopeptide (TPR) repeat protein
MKSLKKRIKRLSMRAAIAYGIVALILFFLGNYKEACTKRLNYITSWGDYPMLLTKDPKIYEERQLYMAIHYYKLLAEIIPKNDQPYGMIGYCYAFLNKNDLSIKYLLKAKSMKPNHFWHAYNLGIMYLRQGRKTEAAEQFQSIIHSDLKYLENAARLSPLNKIIDPTHKERFFKMADTFAYEVRNASLKMLIISDLQNVQNETQEFAFHPWSFFIQPGKEIYY